MTVALGLRVKTGWAAAVLLDGRETPPLLLDSREIRLSDWSMPHGRQPYHATFGVEQTDRAKVARLVKAAERYARAALRALTREYARTGHKVRRGAIVVSSLTDPATVANQHMRAHASEGLLYRRIAAEALKRLGFKTTVLLEREIYERLGRATRRTAASAKDAVNQLGANAARWRSEEKSAAAAAWLLLGNLPRRASRG